MAVKVAQRVGRVTLVSVADRAGVERVCRAGDGKIYCYGGLEVSEKDYIEALRSVGRVISSQPNSERVLVVFKTIPNALNLYRADLTFGDVVCSSCGGKCRRRLTFGERITYCDCCLAAD